MSILLSIGVKIGGNKIDRECFWNNRASFSVEMSQKKVDFGEFRTTSRFFSDRLSSHGQNEGVWLSPRRNFVVISPQRHVRICPFDRNMAIVCWSAIIIKHRMRFSVKGGTVRGVGGLEFGGVFSSLFKEYPCSWCISLHHFCLHLYVCLFNVQLWKFLC